MSHMGTVLVVDDDSRNIDIVCHLLEGLCSIQTAESGEAALEHEKGAGSDLVLLDIMMPGLDGYEVCRRLKAMHPHTKVILVSAKALVEERVKGYEAGADDYIAKPFDHEEFLAKVRVFLKLKETEEQLVAMNAGLEEKVRSRTVQLQQAERAASSAKIYLDNIIRSMSDPLLVLGPDLRILTTNQAAEKLFGFAPPAFVGRHLADLLVRDEDFADLDMAAMAASGLPENKAATFQTAGGGRIPCLLSAATMRDLDGNASGVVCVAKDMRALKRAEEEKEMMHRQVLQASKLASIGELATSIAHEINNPLTIIKGNLDFMKDYLGRAANPALDPVLTQQETAIERIVDIVNGLRVHARKDTGQHSQLNLHVLIEESVTMMKQIFGKRNVRIDKQLGSTAPFVRGNAGRFQQIMVNLLSNARDALEGKADARILVESETRDGRVVVRLSDNGCGIPRDVRDRIFEPFFTTKEAGKGTGLGLSIVNSIVHEMGGTIAVDSDAGKGTVFTLSFPSLAARELLDVTTVKAAPEPAAEARAAKGGRFSGDALVVEDEVEIGLILARYLEEAGFHVDRATDGTEAFELLKHHKYDLLVTDLQMPKMGGETLVREARKAGALGKAKVIALTGNVSHAERADAIPDAARGAIHGLIAKPFSRQQLYDAVKSVL